LEQAVNHIPWFNQVNQTNPKFSVALFMFNLILSLCTASTRPILVALALIMYSASVSAEQYYLEDANLTVPPSPSNPNTPLLNYDFPKILMAETQTLGGDPLQYAKYGTIASSAGTINKIGPIQQINPDLLYFRTINPSAYLGSTNETNQYPCVQGHGNPFSQTTPATEGCGVYAGHWMYEPGTYSTNTISGTSTSIRVSDVSRFSTGEYAVIYDAPAGSFNNAEHVRITGKNSSTNTLTIQRGFKSNASSHASGSIVAQHIRGIGNADPKAWEYNISSQSPRDANNKTYGQALAIWMQTNYNRDLEGDLSDAEVSGFLFDADFDYLFESRNADVNNDLEIDSGYSASGINWYQEGMNEFYGKVRDYFPSFIIVGGTHGARGFEDLNGTQIEGFPNKTDYHSPNPEYPSLSSQLSRYGFHTKRRETGPNHTHILSKTPSKLYPGSTNPAPTNNRAFRFAFGLTLMDDGYFAMQNSSTHPDMWFDEYAVNVVPGSSNYGHAIPSNSNNQSEIIAHKGWLGQPLGHRYRIYNDADYAQENSLVSGAFDNGLDSWTSKNVTISRTTSNPQDGNGALRASNHVGGHAPKVGNATIISPQTNLVNGQDYTLVFSARATEMREISASVGDDYSERFLVNSEWQRYVMSFRATSNNSKARVKFGVGRENTVVIVDSVELFEGDANVFRRDFDNGIVVVNATPDSKTIPLNGTFKRINGQQDSINNGSTISSVTLPAYDSAILVRREGDLPNQGGDSQAPQISITAPTKTSTSTITNTTIQVTDNEQIFANDVIVRSNTTAGVSNFNCSQSSATVVNCTINITSSGNLYLLATDAADNNRFASELNYVIESVTTDDTKPVVTITAPTTNSNTTITDTTIRIVDNVGIDKNDVEVRAVNTTASTQNFICQQNSPTVVSCTIEITSSGDIQIRAIDLAGNITYKNQRDYQITNVANDTSKPYYIVNAPTRISDTIILNVRVVIQDNVGLDASQVKLRQFTTADVRNFTCSQNTTKKVTCTFDIFDSGDVKLMATDLAGNTGYKNITGFRVNLAPYMTSIRNLLLDD